MKHVLPHQASSYSFLERFRSDIERCVRCGACRAVCPSFLADRAESRSARGRMALVKAVLDGRLAVTSVFKDLLATCTDCLACEASCPSGVPVTEIIQAAKEEALRESGPGLVGAVISGVFTSAAGLRLAAWLAPIALRYGPEALGRRGRVPVLPLFSRAFLGTVPEIIGTEHARGRAAFFVGCASNYFQQDIAQAVTWVLGRLGFEVIIPKGQKCCGRPLLSLGERGAAEKLVAENSALFAAVKADAVVTACASCGLTFKRDYPKLLPPGVNPPAIIDIHELLEGALAGADLAPVEMRTACHDPCHLGRGQGLSETVRRILRSIPGLMLVEMENPDRCCGFGGVMRVTHRGLSAGMGRDKARDILSTGASVVATGCPGCRMQITDSLKREGSGVPVLHPVQILEKALKRRA